LVQVRVMAKSGYIDIANGKGPVLLLGVSNSHLPALKPEPRTKEEKLKTEIITNANSREAFVVRQTKYTLFIV